MTQSQSLSIKKNGLVEGGTASYTIVLETGEGLYSYDVKVGALFFHDEEEALNKRFVVTDPTKLLSSNAQTIGNPIDFGVIVFNVTQVGVGQSQVSFTVPGQSITGTGVLDTTGQYVKVISVEAKGSFKGFGFDILGQAVS